MEYKTPEILATSKIVNAQCYKNKPSGGPCNPPKPHGSRF